MSKRNTENPKKELLLLKGEITKLQRRWKLQIDRLKAAEKADAQRGLYHAAILSSSKADMLLVCANEMRFVARKAAP